MMPTQKARSLQDHELLPILRAAERCIQRDPNDPAILDGQPYPPTAWISALEQELARRRITSILPTSANL